MWWRKLQELISQSFVFFPLLLMLCIWSENGEGEEGAGGASQTPANQFTFQSGVSEPLGLSPRKSFGNIRMATYVPFPSTDQTPEHTKNLRQCYRSSFSPTNVRTGLVMARQPP